MKQWMTGLLAGALVGILVFIFYNDSRMLTSILVFVSVSVTSGGLLSLTGPAKKKLKEYNGG